ncbi:DUF1990 family protein [soil metagenome]
MEPDRLERLQDLPLSYPDVGATGTALPDGYGHIGRNTAIGRGLAAFRAAGECLMTWEMHRQAGLQVTASSPRAATGTNVLVRIGPSWLPLDAPCRVLHTVEQPDRIGFTYGTLEGHPEQGEESFSVLLDADEVRFVIIAFSRPASLVTRLAGPVGRFAQGKILDRYQDAVRGAAAA